MAGVVGWVCDVEEGSSNDGRVDCPARIRWNWPTARYSCPFVACTKLAAQNDPLIGTSSLEIVVERLYGEAILAICEDVPKSH